MLRMTPRDIASRATVPMGDYGTTDARYLYNPRICPRCGHATRIRR